MAHQSLYRRYRPRRFGEVRGQEHVVRALRNAVAGGTEGHAYLFSGPRGTGKTSTARILAKALNCEDLREGEPCCECSSCLEIEAGRSFDLFELDAASNNGVDAIRDLVERSVVGSPGRNKVYILDEVHMLSAAASNALLKTLEEPPEHVCFVLATTDPQKVLPTIRSRTQHYEFQLLSAAELETQVRWIATDAGLDVDDEAIAYSVRQGKGSARDTLSALDQVVAGGGVITRVEPVERLLDALAERDTGAAVLSVADSLAQGHDPRVLGDALLTTLRDMFLLSLGVEVVHLVEADRERLLSWVPRLGTPALTRAMELIGTALVDMRQAADTRVPLEVALVRLTAPGDNTLDGLTQRVEALERSVADGGPVAPPAPAPAGGAAVKVDESSDAGAEPASDASATSDTTPGTGGGPAEARAALGALREKQGRATSISQPARSSSAGAPGPPPAMPTSRARKKDKQDSSAAPASEPTTTAARPTTTSAAEPEPSAPAAPVPVPTSTAAAAPPGAGSPDRDALALAFGDAVMPSLKGMSKAIFGGGRFVAVTDKGAVFALDNAPTRDRAEKYRSDVESALGEHLGHPVTLILIDQKDAGRYESGASSAAPPASKMPVAATPPDAATDAPAVDLTDDTADDAADDDDATIIDVHELEDATDVTTSGIERLTEAFPGAVLVEDGEGSA